MAASFQLNAAHDGQIKFDKPFQGPLKRKWSVDLGGGVSSPVYADGRVFVAVSKDDGSYLDALNAASGAILWEVNTQGSLQPAYDNGRVYVVNGSGLVQAFNAQDGSIAWTRQQDGQGFYYSSPVASGGNVYFLGASNETLTVRDGKTGDVRWSELVGGTQMLPAVVGHTVFTAAPCLDLALTTKAGDEKWRYQTGCSGGGGGMPIYFEGRIYVNDGGESVVLDAASGQKLRDIFPSWFVPAFWTNPSGTSLGFIVVKNRYLRAFDTVTGEKVWADRHHSFSTPPLVINDTVVIGAQSEIYGVDAATGSELWSQDINGFIETGFSNAPVGFGAGGNKLFVPTGNLVSAWLSPRSKVRGRVNQTGR